MKRDLSLCRELLLRIEGSMGNPGVYGFPYGDEALVAEGVSNDEIAYNLARMIEAGFFAVGSEMELAGGFLCTGISWAGHDYLDAVRDPDRWRKTREGAKAVGGLTYGMAKDLAMAIAKAEIGAKLGMHL